MLPEHSLDQWMKTTVPQPTIRHKLSTDTKSKFKHNKCLPSVGMGDFQTQVNEHLRYQSQFCLLAPRIINSETQ